MVEAWVAKDRVDEMGAAELDEYLRYARETVQPWEWALTRALNERGLPVVLGTDVAVEGIVPGYSAHQELELLVKAGFTPFEALSTGTRTAAEVAGRMGADDAFGTVDAGNRADLVLLSANPLEDITNSRSIEGVMLRGQWFTQEELDGMVDQYVATFQ
jgi:imidazolonepropionase-like amidohydrolase